MQNTFLTPHFTLLEFTESATASKHGIANNPPPEAVKNLRSLCTHTLEPLREALGLPVIITSGFRCKALNDIIAHHSHQSQHLKGQAADFYVGWGQGLGRDGKTIDEVRDFGVKDESLKFKVQGLKCEGQEAVHKSTSRERLIQAFCLIITNPKIDFDQLIIYPNFIHVSYVSPELNRHYIMTANGNGRYHRISVKDAEKLRMGMGKVEGLKV